MTLLSTDTRELRDIGMVVRVPLERAVVIDMVILMDIIGSLARFYSCVYFGST